MNFCLVPLYIEYNKTSSERLLVVYKELIQTIWPSITLLKHNIIRFPDQEIDNDEDDIINCNKTIDLYYSFTIFKINNAIEIRT